MVDIQDKYWNRIEDYILKWYQVLIRIASLEGSSTNAASRFYMLEDGTANIRLYTDYGGALVEYYMYDPYGVAIYQGPSNLNINISNNGAGSTNTVNYTGPVAGASTNSKHRNWIILPSSISLGLAIMIQALEDSFPGTHYKVI